MKQLKYITNIILVITFMTLLGCASTEKHAGTGEYIDDTVITTKVKAAVLNEESLKSAEINVETFKGVVQLSGFVNSGASKLLSNSMDRGKKPIKLGFYYLIALTNAPLNCRPIQNYNTASGVFN